MLGGDIWVESQMGKGSSFIFTIKKKQVDILKKSKLFKAKHLYASEVLTQERYKLLIHTKKSGNFKFIWTRDGNIFAKKNESSPVINIKHNNQLHNE